MKHKFIKLLLILIGIVFFDILFWEQNSGINLSLFCLFLCVIGLYRKPILKQRRESLLALAMVLITSFNSVWHHSDLSITMLIISTIIFFGFLKQAELRTTFSAFFFSLIHVFSIPFAVLRSIKKFEKFNSVGKLLGRLIGNGLIPLIIFLVFFFIYRQANPKFEELSQNLVFALGNMLEGVEIGRFFFILFGLCLLSCALLSSYFSVNSWLIGGDELIRKKNINKNQQSTSSVAPLIFENRTAIILFGVLNLLLLVINIIDIDWIWFGFEVPQEFNLKQFVHEGTYLLILSILLSIGILLYFFRGSLNFYPKNKMLLSLAKVWMIQNAVLCLSVFLRNYHYIDYHGMASKRIGVIAFLLMTFFGILSLWVKINRKKSLFFLLRINSWFILSSLVFMSSFNWDKIIAIRNMNHHNAGEIDVDNYLFLDPTVAPIIYDNLDIIEAQMEAHLNRTNKTKWLYYTNIDTFKLALEDRIKMHLRKRLNDEWPAWNYADYRLKKFSYSMN